MSWAFLWVFIVDQRGQTAEHGTNSEAKAVRFRSNMTSLSARLSPSFVQLLQRAVIALAIIHFLFQLGCILPIQLARPYKSPNRQFDMDMYYSAALRLKQGVDVYEPWPEYVPKMTPNRFFYSPPFLLLTRPLVDLGYPTFARVWLILITIAFWVYAVCLAKLTTGWWNWKAALVFGMIINLGMSGDATIGVGQFEPFIWMMFGLALTTQHRAGWLALATLVKVHPIWSLCLVLHAGKARAWKHMLLFALPVLLGSLWLVGMHNWAMWWPSTSPVASQGTFNIANWSLSIAVLRVLHSMGWLQTDASFPVWAKAFLSLCAVGAPLTMAYVARKASRELQLALVASAGVLFAPICWKIYSPLLLLPLTVWLGENRSKLAASTEP